MVISREQYLEALKIRMHNGLIKVITGIRRCGKSFLVFKIFKNFLLESGVQQDHIIEIEFDRRENKEYRNPDVVLEFIKNQIKDDERYYILLDEVQLLAEFEEVLNSLLHIENADVYVTGSNSKFLSKDIITEFRGRGDEVHVYPLCFREFMEAFEGDRYQGLTEYMNYGGLPAVAGMKTEAQKVSYLTKLFEETYIIDIMERYHIERVQELNDLINILASGVGTLSNPTKIKDTFKSVIRSDISLNTVRQYIEHLKDVFLINEAQRYDVKGRKYIGTPVKYYFEDLGLRNARLKFRQTEETHLMENMIYNELLVRGFQVDVGVVTKREKQAGGVTAKKSLEVDFVANQGSRRYYIQSAYSLPDSEKIKQEKASLNHISDSFKKIVIVKDVIKTGHDENGITLMSIYDFLMYSNSLEL